MECGWGLEVVINLSKNDGLYLRSLILQLLIYLSVVIRADSYLFHFHCTQRVACC